MEPDRAAVVAGACVVLHNMAKAWNVPLVEEELAGDGDDDPDIPPGLDGIQAEAATVRAYLTTTFFS